MSRDPIARLLATALLLAGLAGVLLAAACGGQPPEGGGAVVTVDVPSGHRLGGVASGIPPSGVTLAEGSAGTLRLDRDGPFWFGVRLSEGTPYAVTIEAVPGFACSLANERGTVGSTDVASIQVGCIPLSPAPGG